MRYRIIRNDGVIKTFEHYFPSNILTYQPRDQQIERQHIGSLARFDLRLDLQQTPVDHFQLRDVPIVARLCQQIGQTYQVFIDRLR